MKNKILIFDLDDTLYKEIDFLYSAYREIAEWIELKFSLERVYAFMTETYREKADVFSHLIDTYDLPLTKADLLSVYRSHRPDIRLEPETLKTLGILKQDCTLGMITDGRSITQRNKFQVLGLEQFIMNENLVISEEFGSEKPSERNFMFFQDKYADAKFVYVGDNLRKDFITPNKLGWKTICLLDDGKNIHRQDFSCPKEYLPTVKIRTLKELLSL